MGPGTGGDKPRPCEEAEGGSVGADFISARCPRVGCTFAERTPLWRTEPSNPGTNWKLVPGGHTGRPYEETKGGSVGADFISARCPRVGCTFAERTPLWRTEPSNPGTNWKLVPGGHTGRPYEEAEGGSVGADFISARCPRVGCTFAERTPLRRTESLSPGASRDPVSLQPPPSQVRLIAGHVLQTAVQQRAQVRQGVGGNGQVLL